MDNIDFTNIDLEHMTKAEALGLLGLNEDATTFMIDDKFWQLSKRYRLDTSPEGKQKVEILSNIYDIASGKRDERKEAEEQYSKAKKYFGKTSDEWVNYVQYTWYKYLIAVVLIVTCGNLVYHMFFAPKIDSCIVSLGHFYVEDAYLDTFLVEDMHFENPYVGSSNIVVPNDQNQSAEAYSEISATTMFLSYPNLVISDEQTVKYYFDNCTDLSSFYQKCREQLSPEAFAKITPVYCSEEDYHALLREYEEARELTSTEENDVQYSKRQILIGLEINDSEIIKSMGYKTLWPNDEPNLVFFIYNQSMNYTDSENILITLLNKIL